MSGAREICEKQLKAIWLNSGYRVVFYHLLSSGGQSTAQMTPLRLLLS